MTSHPMHIVFAGGGTGGHLFPGLAVAERLAVEAPGVRITFAGTGKSFERRHVAAAGFEYLALRCGPMPRRWNGILRFVADQVAGYREARRFVDQEHVAAVVGLGGYASVPMARAAVARGTPLVLLEQNVAAGRATRWLARRANLICTSFPETGPRLRHRCPLRVTGNPIRTGKWGGLPGGRNHGRQDAYPTLRLARQQKRLLVLGGSGGARAINENVSRALYKVGPRLAGWEVIHQSGDSDLDATGELYRKLNVQATVVDFIADLPELLSGIDLAVCRSGGTTLAELAASGVPAVLLPYPDAADDHQRKNADWFVSGGGSAVLDQRELVGRLDDRLAEVVSELVADSDKRGRMSAAMRRLSRPKAAADVATLILDLVAGQPWKTAMPAAA